MPLKTSLLWGIYLGVALSLGTQILTWMGLGLTNWFVALSAIFVIVFVALCLKQVKKLNHGKLTFINAALSVFIVILISRYIFQLYMFVYINYIDSSWVDTVAEYWSNMLREADKPGEEIAQTIASFRKANTTFDMFTIEIAKYGLSQFIMGMIVSVFFVFNFGRKKAIPGDQ